MTPVQVRAARLLLGWSRDRLAGRSAIPVNAVTFYERGRSGPSTTPDRIAAIRAALEGAGVEFTDGDMPRVRLRK